MSYDSSRPVEGISIGILIYCLLFCIIVSSASLKVGTISSKACAYSYAFLFMRVSLNDSVNCQAEIETHAQPGILSLYVHYGQSRPKDARTLAQSDVVITTYGVLASEFSAEVI